MTNRLEYKEALSRLNKDTRICLLYLEGLIEERFQLAMKAKQPPTIKPDFSKLESKDDSLQKQIDGLRPKIEEAHSFVQEYDEQEAYLKNLTKNAEKILDEMKKQFEELYDSGYYSEGKRRKIRDEGLVGDRPRDG